MAPRRKLTAKIEPFDSFWEGPEDVESGYRSYALFYKDNYLKYLPKEKDANILCVSCGPGYLVSLLKDRGYRNVLGIDSFPDKISYAEKHGLNCRVAHAFDFLEDAGEEEYDVIFCEQEVNHLSKDEILEFLSLCKSRLRPCGLLIFFVLNGANPLTGAEALAQNFDHYNTFTEYTVRQVLEFSGFDSIRVIGLNLYVYYRNPANYVAMFAAWLLTVIFRAGYILYGKKNRLFTKKIAAICRKPA